MSLFSKLFPSANHVINLVAEFNTNTNSECMIADLSKYINKIVRDCDIVYTDFQSHPKGYRITYKIEYKTNFFKRKNYTKELSRLSDWMGSNKSYNGCLYRYQYTCV